MNDSNNELLNVYLNENKKKTFQYIIKFINLILTKKTTPVLDENWEIVQKTTQGIILYSEKKELLMEVKKSIDVLQAKEEFIINITPSKDRGYQQAEISFDKDNFDQYEIIQFWFNAMPPTITFKVDNYFIPESQSLHYFLTAFKLEQYFINLTETTIKEKEYFENITNKLLDQINYLKTYCKKEYIEWKNKDKHYKILNDENNNLLFYIANREQIHENLLKIHQLKPNLILENNKIVLYDKYLYSFINEIEVLYNACLNKSNKIESENKYKSHHI